jgi:hypothetical protein
MQSLKGTMQLILCWGIADAEGAQRYELNLPYVDDWFPPAESTISISVLDMVTEQTFERVIPKAYLFHLHWISGEASPQQVGTKKQRRSSYLRQVLDAFAKEIEETSEFSDWRSAALTPVLVRAYHNLSDFASSSIGTYLKRLLLHRGRLTVQHWADFYFQSDVIDTGNSGRWTSLKKVVPQKIQVGSSFTALKIEYTPMICS